MNNPKPASRFPLSKTNNLSKLTTKKHVTAVIDEKIKKIFYSLLIYCFIFSVISCGKTTEENVNGAVAKTNDTVFGDTAGSGVSGDRAPKNIVFGKYILDPDATQSKDYEESASDVIQTSGGD